MKIIVIYLCIGALLNIFGPLAKMIKEEIKDSKNLSEKKENTKQKTITYIFILRLLSLIAYPILYGVLLFDYLFEIPKDKNLYFWNMGGAGQIFCKECDYSENIVSFLHGFGKDPWTKCSFQCQSCGKYYEFERDTKNSNGVKCECGGSLSRDMPIFCPKCKNKNVVYITSYIT